MNMEKKINKEKKENSWFDLFAKKVTNLSDEILKITDYSFT